MIMTRVKNEKTVKAMESLAHLVLNDDFMREYKTELSIAAGLFLKETIEYKNKEGGCVGFIAPLEDGKFIIDSLYSLANGNFNEVDLEEFSCKFIAAIITSKAAKEMGLI